MLAIISSSSSACSCCFSTDRSYGCSMTLESVWTCHWLKSLNSSFFSLSCSPAPSRGCSASLPSSPSASLGGLESGSHAWVHALWYCLCFQSLSWKWFLPCSRCTKCTTGRWAGRHDLHHLFANIELLPLVDVLYRFLIPHLDGGHKLLHFLPVIGKLSLGIFNQAKSGR